MRWYHCSRLGVPRHAAGDALKKKRKKGSFGRTSRRGGHAKPGAGDELLVAKRDTTAAVETAQAAAIGAAQEGADARDQAVAAAAVRAAARDAVRANDAVAQRKRKAGATPSPQPPKKSRRSTDPPQAVAPAAAAPAAAQPPPGPAANPTRPRGRPSKAPANAKKKEERRQRNRRYVIKKLATKANASAAEEPAAATPTATPFSLTKGGKKRPSDTAERMAKMRATKPCVDRILRAGSTAKEQGAALQAVVDHLRLAGVLRHTDLKPSGLVAFPSPPTTPDSHFFLSTTLACNLRKFLRVSPRTTTGSLHLPSGTRDCHGCDLGPVRALSRFLTFSSV